MTVCIVCFYVTAIQTEMTMADLEALEARSLAAETKFQQDRWSANKISDNDKATKFFTGLRLRNK